MRQTYHLPDRAVVEFYDALRGRVRAEFDAGEHQPDSEDEEDALDKLVRQGLADVVTDDGDSDDEEDN